MRVASKSITVSGETLATLIQRRAGHEGFSGLLDQFGGGAAPVLGTDLAEYLQPAVDGGTDLVAALLQRQRHHIVGNLDRGKADLLGFAIELTSAAAP